LKYVIAKRQGKRKELENIIGVNRVMEFKKGKLIRLGLLRWTKLANADKLYVSRYGYLSYLCLLLKSDKMMSKISNLFMQWLNSKSMTPTAMFPIA
jgi:hypothetical protein